MMADMTTVKYNKKGKGGSWKDKRIKEIESQKVWDESNGVKTYRKLKPTASFDLNTVQNLAK